MIHLTLFDDTPIIINPFHIFAIKSVEGGSFITASGGGSITVKETAAQVEAAVKRSTVHGAQEGRVTD
jgi:uncharacterized protein YlzI (FlbEa/FlbD family)